MPLRGVEELRAHVSDYELLWGLLRGSVGFQWSSIGSCEGVRWGVSMRHDEREL